MGKLEEKIFVALGEVSMCWSERPKGIFESTKARQIGDDLVAEIKNIIEARPKEFRCWIKSANSYMMKYSEIAIMTPYNTSCLGYAEDDLMWEQNTGEVDIDNNIIFENDIVENGKIIGNTHLMKENF